MVLQRGRRCPLPDRRYLVADGNRWPTDHTATRRDGLKPGSATLPFFGVVLAIVDGEGE